MSVLYYTHFHLFMKMSSGSLTDTPGVHSSWGCQHHLDAYIGEMDQNILGFPDSLL